MADFAARITELESLLSLAINDVIRLQSPAGDLNTNHPRFVALRSMLANHADTREKALTASLVLLDAPADATAESAQQRWSAELNRLGTEAFQRINDAVKNEHILIKTRFEIVAMQEARAFRLLADLPLGTLTGRLRSHIRELSKETQTFTNLWKEQSGQEERYDGQIATVRVQALDAFKRAVAEMRGWGPRTEQALRTSVEGWSAQAGSDPEPSIGSVGADAGKHVLASIETLQFTHEQSTRIAMPHYAGKTTIHQMFANTRQNVKDFLDKVNLDTTTRELTAAFEAAQSLIAAVIQPGQRQDLTDFLGRAMFKVRDISVQFTTEWQRFYGAFKGIYVEEPSEATLDKLAEAEFFNRFWRDVADLNLPGVFREVSDAIMRCESITAARITPEQQRRLTEVIQARTSKIKDRIRSLDMSMFERAKLLYYDVTIDQMRDWVKRLPGYRK